MNTKHRSLLLCATLCGAWMWTGPAQAQLVGGALGGGATGSALGGPGLAVGGGLRMDASGSLHANPGELRAAAAEARQSAAERARATRDRAGAAGHRAVDTARSTAAAVHGTNAAMEAGISGRVDAGRVSTEESTVPTSRKAKDAPPSDERVSDQAGKAGERTNKSSAKRARSHRPAPAAGAESN